MSKGFVSACIAILLLAALPGCVAPYPVHGGGYGHGPRYAEWRGGGYHGGGYHGGGWGRRGGW